MNTIAEKFIQGLKMAYFDNNAKDTWNHFEKIKEGASSKDIEKLKKVFPEIPKSLIDLLEYVDGTYWREYAGEEISFFFLGSDVEEYPYYLMSCEQIIENQYFVNDYYSDYIERVYENEGMEVDVKITTDTENLKWLHFSDCCNNGGTSQLFIDFTPSSEGKKGQIVRFLHDPDELKVIADSFDTYLQLLIDKGYDFIDEEID